MSRRLFAFFLIVSVGFSYGCSTGGDEQPQRAPQSGDTLDAGQPPDVAVPTTPPPESTNDAAPALAADAGSPPPKPDTRAPTPTPDLGVPDPDLGALVDWGMAPTNRKVAAVQYGQGQAKSVDARCVKTKLPDVCALKNLASTARANGAQLIVLPEYAIDQEFLEPVPTVGKTPATSSQWPADTIIKTMSWHARVLGAYLVFDMQTYAGQKPNYDYYNTQIAFDPTGKVVAYHHKFNLFGDENSVLTPGKSVTTFDTPLGKVGLLICADIYGSTTLNNALARQADLVAVSSYWTVNGAVSWYRSYAAKYGMYTIVSNHTHSKGNGGGIYKPNGSPIVEKEQSYPTILYATLP